MDQYSDSFNFAIGVSNSSIDPLNNGYFQFKAYIFNTSTNTIFNELKLEKCNSEEKSKM